MEQIPSSGANIFSVNQEVLRYLWNPTLHLQKSCQPCT